MPKSNRVMMLLISDNRFFDWLRSNHYFGYEARFEQDEHDLPEPAILDGWLHEYITTACDWAGWKVCESVFFLIERELGEAISGNAMCGQVINQQAAMMVINRLTLDQIKTIPIFNLDLQAMMNNIAMRALAGLR